MQPTGALVVIPSRLGVGEEFSVKIKLRGEVREIPCEGGWNTVKPRLRGPFNLNVQRNFQYLDDTLPEWCGELTVDGGEALAGPDRLEFDGKNQGAFPRDSRPIKSFGGFRWAEPGFHFLKVTDTESGQEFSSNAVCVTEEPPSERLYWGDPHWQSFFSDGIRCPEELYAFARDEAFLDFGAISDHVEALTDRQWDYFVGVTNDYNERGRFATLVGLEWTSHEPGHRNIYYLGDSGLCLRCTDPRYDTLDKLWRALDGIEAIAIPHHSANKVMGVDWSLGWNPRYEKAVEMYSVWGNSECPKEEGNPRPIVVLKGEDPGHHVVDALKAGFRFGFVGGGDIHDGRPGDDLTPETSKNPVYQQGLTASFAPGLSRETIYHSLKRRRTYATTRSRIYLDATLQTPSEISVKAASEEEIECVTIVCNGNRAGTLEPQEDPRIIDTKVVVEPLGPDEFCYLRVNTKQGNMAWASPFWGDG